MSDLAGENINKAVGNLISTMEKMYERQAGEQDRMEKVMSSLDRLCSALDSMNSSRSFEADFYKKIELLNESLERTMSIQEGVIKGREGAEKSVNRVINGAKIFGQILSAVAASVQLAVDNVGMVLKKDTDEKPAVEDITRLTKTQADVALLLQPLSTLVKNLVDEKLKPPATLPEAEERLKNDVLLEDMSRAEKNINRKVKIERE